ncbi:MAG: hypothetical protein ACKV2T_38305 [Kofleriaceae bacterium]
MAVLARVLADGETSLGHVKLTVGSGESRAPVSFAQMRSHKNSTFVNQHGTSIGIHTEMEARARQTGLTERDLGQEFINFQDTGRLHPRILADPALHLLLAREQLRLFGLEPARVLGHYPEVANARARMARSRSIDDFEVPADIAPIDGKREGAVKSHQHAKRIADGEHVEPGVSSDSGERVLASQQSDTRSIDRELFWNPRLLADYVYRRTKERLGR